jgi:hypothetical protein
VPPAQWDDVEVRRLITTGIDGSGAIGVLAHCRNKRKNVLGSLVLKHGVGVRDAWAQEGTQKEIDRTFLDAAVVDQFTIAPDFLLTVIGHFLALGHQTGTMPPFGLVRLLEAVGVSSVHTWRLPGLCPLPSPPSSPKPRWPPSGSSRTRCATTASAAYT